jgi:3-oxoacyl-[acyl-carrier-protein] synthase-1
LNLGEGAGYIVLESEVSILKSNSKPIGILSGWNSSSDAYHQTASSPEGYGAVLSMRGALEMSCLNCNEISYINAHGTSTPNNDASESMALKTVFEGNVPAFSSTKSYTGHTLAASGGIEAVYALLAINRGVLFPNLNFSQAITETQLIPQQIFEEQKRVNHVLSNSFGFGGNNSSIIISSLN